MRNILIVLLLSIPFFLSAQKKEDKESQKWDVSNPGKHFNYKTHRFKTYEGTWINMDVSTDGNTIVFDMLGDIYILHIKCGKAKALRTGIPFEIQPRFSPDG